MIGLFWTHEKKMLIMQMYNSIYLSFYCAHDSNSINFEEQTKMLYNTHFWVFSENISTKQPGPLKIWRDKLRQWWRQQGLHQLCFCLCKIFVSLGFLLVSYIFIELLTQIKDKKILYVCSCRLLLPKQCESKKKDNRYLNNTIIIV